MKVSATTDADSLTRTLESIADRASDLTGFWRSELDDWYQAQQGRYFTVASPVRPLRGSTVRRKKGNVQPLVRTGALRDAVLSQQSSPAKIRDLEAWFGLPRGNSQRGKAIYAFRGTSSRPPRSIRMDRSDLAKADLADRLGAWIIRRLGD